MDDTLKVVYVIMAFKKKLDPLFAVKYLDSMEAAGEFIRKYKIKNEFTKKTQ